MVRVHPEEFPDVAVEVLKSILKHEPVVLRFADAGASGRESIAHDPGNVIPCFTRQGDDDFGRPSGIGDRAGSELFPLPVDAAVDDGDSRPPLARRMIRRRGDKLLRPIHDGDVAAEMNHNSSVRSNHHHANGFRPSTRRASASCPRCDISCIAMNRSN